ncbi:MAG: Homoserine kinase [Candidatus Collierbacteria bacterium GW2011_GWB1_44_35]|uniref:Homoserine kinase n=5 Tax=Candidatus Collieribacteriota TaxID=1752725 RepID=A0A0G1HIX5_9BACT|nr:MAG: Homoserine kinase [Candidatus Collierbacteria bacterium GW2011_GWA1_44_12]KKT39270.1 MAG: Homoserine kinase [Candidatus Collierbacteria bacterium GW2011_GWF1_44_12]KKT47176.1 MAG: Homoserine kinase [Candidatus Collierbacteria bacterium GW2011_GWF2_44_15]KKT67876.1 MAG: Homoserine kinase [Candidatus Collierbacteria bacterium GW2011_GWB1_44_35]KKT99452.1 MAG: Homoserine kinase [Candidatus Collierbacteria bacterium GW2011_GWC2_45_15]
MLTETYFHDHHQEFDAFFDHIEGFNFLRQIKENVFLIEINGEKYVLKVYDEKCDRNRLTFFENLQNHTSDALSISPKVVPTLFGNLNVQIGHDIWELCEYEEGQDFNPEKKRPEQVFYDTGLFLGQVHRVFESYHSENLSTPDSILLHFPDSPAHIFELLSEYYQSRVGQEWQKILEEKISIAESLKEYNDFSTLPQQIVHGDFYPRNLLYDEEMNIKGLIDYAQAGIYYRCYEVIRAAIQTNKYLGFIELKPEYLSHFLEGYSKSVELTKDEAEMMLSLYIFIQASDISFFKTDIVLGDNSALKDYATYRHKSLVSLTQNSLELNNIIQGQKWNKSI